MIKAIIFDLDGVILESADIKTKAFRRLFERDFPNKVDAIVKYHIDNMGISRYVKFKYIYEHILKTSLSPEKEEGLSKEFSRIALEEILHTPFVPGALEFIRARHEKYCLCIISATPDKELHYIVEKRGIHDYFREIYGYPPGKVERIRDILSRNRWSPQEIVFVGDAQNDREAASETGLHFVARIHLGCDSLYDTKHKIRDLNALDSILSIIEREDRRSFRPKEPYACSHNYKMGALKERQRINVALVCTSMNQVGGRDKHFRNIYRYMQRDRFKVYLVCCSKIENELKRLMLGGGVQKEDLILLPWTEKRLVLPFILRLRKIFLDKKIDIVHTFQNQSDIFGGVAARLAGIGCIVSQYESKIIDDNIPFIKQWLYKIANAIIKNWFRKTVVVASGIKDEAVSRNFRPPKTIKVIRLGFNLPEKYVRKTYSYDRLKEKRPIIGTITRLSKEKGVGRFIEIMPFILKNIAQAQFLIMGTGEEENVLKKQARRLGLDSKVIFLGWHDDVYDTLESIDIFVMPSLREGCPTALLEAMAFARPVVASNIDGIKDIIEDGKDGLLVDTSNIPLFAEKILYLCENPLRAIQSAVNAREKILRFFTLEREIKQLSDVYYETLTQAS